MDLKKITKNSKTWNEFLKPALNVAALMTGMAVGANTKNPEVAQATAIVLECISGGRVSSLLDIFGNGLRLYVL